MQCPGVAGEGVITYMRTDGVQLAQEIVDGARAYVSQHHGAEYLPEQPRVYKFVGSRGPPASRPHGSSCLSAGLLDSVRDSWALMSAPA